MTETYAASGLQRVSEDTSTEQLGPDQATGILRDGARLAMNSNAYRDRSGS